MSQPIMRHIPDVEKLKLQGYGLDKISRQMRRRVEREKQKTKIKHGICRSCQAKDRPLDITWMMCKDCIEKLVRKRTINTTNSEVKLIGSTH